jgi:DNA-binding FadR family transcriptional regulator
VLDPAAGTVRRYVTIAEALADQIVSGVYRPGHRLPAERDLAAEFSVSRTTVREALLALELSRYVEIRTGSGVFVTKRDASHSEQRSLLLEVSVDPGPYEVIEMRRILEAASAQRAASRADDTALDAIEKTTARWPGALNDHPSFEAADYRFHALIAEAADNAILPGLIEYLWSFRNSPMWSRWYAQTRSIENRRRSVEDHRSILRALKRRLPDMAETAMELHLDTLAERFFALGLSNRSHPVIAD